MADWSPSDWRENDVRPSRVRSPEKFFSTAARADPATLGDVQVDGTTFVETCRRQCERRRGGAAVDVVGGQLEP